MVQLKHWLAAARMAAVPEPEAMTLASVGADGRPSARMVLLRGLGPDGVDLYTNRESRKGRELERGGHAALVLYWESMGRQIRARGSGGAPRRREQRSNACFQGRPRGSRIAAWASPQSRPIADRAELDRLVAEAEARFRTRCHCRRSGAGTG